jgi:hypothetical protein
MSTTNSQDSDDEMEDCPICVEPFDESDRMFLPCQCNYRVCMFCVRRLMTEFDGRCPGCRSVYNEANFRIREIDPEEVERRKLREKQKNQEKLRQQQQASKQAASQIPQKGSGVAGGTAAAGGGRGGVAAGQGSAVARKTTTTSHLSPIGGPLGQQTNTSSEQENALAQQRKNLANVRVVQNHVVFVLGLPLSLAKEDILRRPEHFGQYGPIQKIVVGHPASAPGRTASASAHITFTRADDAREAIRGVDGVVVDGHQIRASFGTSRYCHSFLRGQQCPNPECLFLHQEVDPSAQTLNRPASGTTGSPAIGANLQPQQQQTSQQLSVVGGNTSSSTFGGTDPFALENVPEPLNGIDIAQYEKTRTRPSGTTVAGATPLTPQVHGSRAPGFGRPLASPSGTISATSSPLAGPSSVPTNGSPVTSNGVPHSQQTVSYDCALSLVADLVMSRATMSDDLRRKLSWVTGPRAKSNQFSGLECILSGPAPLFIAPTIANSENTDPSQQTTSGEEDNVPVKGGDGGSSTTGPSQVADKTSSTNTSDKQQQSTTNTTKDSDLTNKDKKLTRKNKKAAFAAQNRIGGDPTDAY